MQRSFDEGVAMTKVAVIKALLDKEIPNYEESRVLDMIRQIVAADVKGAPFSEE